ncbi:G-protein-signaling modulator 2 [Bombyx mori]|uniref:G-protein-signaling modulator 2 n=1 Tax=Bombyx mori TaxID=7091 RepID=A0A8R2LW59_BOMMO|nr:G-protein-signaling modulator 2 isoform X1 [Bombyx mori]
MSVSASAENLSTDAQSCDGGSMCLELALEGERLCKAGDCKAGVAFFQAAIQAGTDDLRTLSAIYSQMGNAYFYLGEYHKAVQYHRHDLTLARTMNDKLGEAKASGNLGNTLKVIGKFNEAIQCCLRHLEISRSLGDRNSEGRALYNLANVYHAQGKHLGKVGQNDPGHFPQEVRECLLQAVNYYEQNLVLMRELNDRLAIGRACGNLGNTYYLLGEFNVAVQYHTERLEMAKECKDKAAERRAHSNLGNSHIFLGQFENAADHYKQTLAIAEELKDEAVVAQACYSLGNTYTLLREYRIAEEYHARHLEAARKLQDRVGEGRACWSLGNAHAALGNHEKALYYAIEHYTISKEICDVLGMATAQMNINDLRKVLGLPPLAETAAAQPAPPDQAGSSQTPFNALRVRRQSMEQLSLIQLTPDGKKDPEDAQKKAVLMRSESEDSPMESFLDLLSKYQSERMDEQRATLVETKEIQETPKPTEKPKPSSSKLFRSSSSGSKQYDSNEALLDMITDLQSERMDSQRAELRPIKKKLSKEMKGTSLPGLRTARVAGAKPEDDFLDMIARVQGTRLDDQRTEMPRPKADPRPKTVPDDDFFALIMRAQSGRMEDQRAAIPKPAENRQSKPAPKPRK